MRTAALVGLDGAIDWCCLPRFDSGSVFAALLDPERGGTWAIRPEGEWTSTQRYLPRTNILETTFRTADDGVGHRDRLHAGGRGRPAFGRASRDPSAAALHPRPGARCSMVFMPRFEYGARATRLELLRGRPVRHRPHRPGAHALERQAVRVGHRAVDRDHPVRAGEGRGALAGPALRRRRHPPGRPLRERPQARRSPPRSGRSGRRGCATSGPFRGHGEALGAGPQAAHPRGDRRASSPRRRPHCPRRSAECATGTIASSGSGTPRSPSRRSTPSATTGRPTRSCGSSRRSAGTRGAATSRSCTGSTDAATWSSASSTTSSGYRGSRPVRVGNGAVGQLQLDVYGEVMETADIWRRNHEMTEGTWRVLRGLVDWVSKNWHLPDSSIWEVRGEVRHYVFSKVMSWVALDRGVRMAEELSLEGEHRRLAGRAGRAARRDHGARLERGAPVIRAVLRRRCARRRRAGHPDGPVSPVEPSPGAQHGAGDRAGAHQRRRRAGVPLPAARTGWRGRRARSRSAPSGWRRPWR